VRRVVGHPKHPCAHPAAPIMRGAGAQPVDGQCQAQTSGHGSGRLLETNGGSQPLSIPASCSSSARRRFTRMCAAACQVSGVAALAGWVMWRTVRLSCPGARNACLDRPGRPAAAASTTRCWLSEGPAALRHAGTDAGVSAPNRTRGVSAAAGGCWVVRLLCNRRCTNV